jgi:hypothetical protein
MKYVVRVIKIACVRVHETRGLTRTCNKLPRPRTTKRFPQIAALEADLHEQARVT